MANPLGHRYAFISLWLRIKHLHRDGCSTRPGSSSHSALTAKGKGGGGIRKRTPTPKQQTFAKRGWFWSQEHQFLGRINDVTVHSWRKDDDSCIYLFVFCLLWWSSVPPFILVRFHLRLRRGSKCSRPTWMSPPSGIHPRCTRTDTSLCKKTKTKTALAPNRTLHLVSWGGAALHPKAQTLCIQCRETWLMKRPASDL